MPIPLPDPQRPASRHTPTFARSPPPTRQPTPRRPVRRPDDRGEPAGEGPVTGSRRPGPGTVPATDAPRPVEGRGVRVAPHEGMTVGQGHNSFEEHARRSMTPQGSANRAAARTVVHRSNSLSRHGFKPYSPLPVHGTSIVGHARFRRNPRHSGRPGSVSWRGRDRLARRRDSGNPSRPAACGLKGHVPAADRAWQAAGIGQPDRKGLPDRPRGRAGRP